MERKWIVVILLIAVVIGLLLYFAFSSDNEARIILAQPAISYIAHGPMQAEIEQLKLHGGVPAPVMQKKTQSSKREEACRLIFEEIFGAKFESTRRLSWLTNPETGHRLELDGYNKDLGIAFEFNGVQHYEYPNHLHRDETEFIAQKRRDIFKHHQCDKNGVYLITIPYTVKDKDLKAFILDKLPTGPQTPELSAMYTYDEELFNR